jgi:hypothetical protein
VSRKYITVYFVYRLIFAEDLSATTIPGSYFALDPLYFEDHVKGIEEFGAEVKRLGIIRTAKWFLSNTLQQLVQVH